MLTRLQRRSRREKSGRRAAVIGRVERKIRTRDADRLKRLRGPEDAGEIEIEPGVQHIHVAGICDRRAVNDGAIAAADVQRVAHRMFGDVDSRVFGIQRQARQRDGGEGGQRQRVVLKDLLRQDRAAEVEIFVQRVEIKAEPRQVERVELHGQPVLVSRSSAQRAGHRVRVRDRYRGPQCLRE